MKLSAGDIRGEALSLDAVYRQALGYPLYNINDGTGQTFYSQQHTRQ